MYSKPILSFSGMNYVGNILNLLPTLVVPLIVVSKVGTSEAAYYYVSFQLASLLYSAAYSVENAFLAEGSQSATVSRAILMRSARILIALCASSFIVVLLFGHLMLSAFGAKYGSNAESSLVPAHGRGSADRRVLLVSHCAPAIESASRGRLV